MKTDREAQGRQRDSGKDKGLWDGEFVCNFWEDRVTLGKTRALGWGKSYAILGIVEKLIK